MIIYYLHVREPAFIRTEAYSILIINANAVLPESISLQALKTICRRHSQILEAGGVIHHDQLAQCSTLYGLR